MDGSKTGGIKGSKGERRLSCSPEHVMELVRRTQQGDVSAEHELHAIFAPKLLAVLARHRGDATVADDLDGQGYLLLHARILGFDEARGVNFFTFLDLTLAEDAWSYVRSERRDAARSQAACPPAAGEGSDSPADPEQAFEAPIRRERGWLEQGSSVEEVVVLRCTLAEVAKVLPEDQWKVLQLRADGYTFVEIATALGGTAEGWRQAYHRGRVRLREALEEIR